jgi:hypothetical protein
MISLKGKKAYFFMIDSFIAVTILSMGLFVILSSYTDSSPGTQLSMTSQDVMNYLTSTPIKTFVDPEGLVDRKELIDRGSIDNSLIEQILEYRYLGEIDRSGNLTREAIELIVPEQFEIQIFVDDSLLYRRSIADPEDSKLIIPSNAYILTVYQQTEIIGPHLVEVMVWQ